MPKKRANGEGSIRKRSDGRWEGRYTVGHDPVTGKQIFKNVLGKTQAEVKEGPLKTKNAYRTVAIGDDVIAILKDLQEREGKRSPYLFPSPNGGPQDPDSVLPMFKRILKRAGLPEMRFHDCRHTVSVLALSNGVDYKTLSAMLGHYSVAFTLDVYGHVTDDMKRDAAEKVSGVLKGAV